MNRRLHAILCSLLFTVAAVPIMGAAPQRSNPPAAAPGAGFSFQDWQIKTDQIDYMYQSGEFNIPSHVTLVRPGSQIQADRATGNQKTKQATLTGHVVLHDYTGSLASMGGQGGSHDPATLTCDTLQIDGASKTYTAIGNVRFMQGSSRASADRAVMNGLTHDLHLYGNVQLKQ
jgi:lipopolysaccharide assembly outer membrane protein LptD (OstA)